MFINLHLNLIRWTSRVIYSHNSPAWICQKTRNLTLTRIYNYDYCLCYVLCEELLMIIATSVGGEFTEKDAWVFAYVIL